MGLNNRPAQTKTETQHQSTVPPAAERKRKKQAHNESTAELLARLNIPKVHPKSRTAKDEKAKARAAREERDKEDKAKREDAEARKRRAEADAQRRRDEESKKPRPGFWHRAETPRDDDSKHHKSQSHRHNSPNEEAKQKKSVAEGWAKYERDWAAFLSDLSFSQEGECCHTAVPWPKPNLFKKYLARAARCEDPAEVNQRYWALARRFHPDKFQSTVARYLASEDATAACAYACELAKQVNLAFGK